MKNLGLFLLLKTEIISQIQGQDQEKKNGKRKEVKMNKNLKEGIKEKEVLIRG